MKKIELAQVIIAAENRMDPDADFDEYPWYIRDSIRRLAKNWNKTQLLARYEVAEKVNEQNREAVKSGKRTWRNGVS